MTRAEYSDAIWTTSYWWLMGAGWVVLLAALYYVVIAAVPYRYEPPMWVSVVVGFLGAASIALIMFIAECNSHPWNAFCHRVWL